jgi:sugar-specific transcriptional regulator TrmB/DNA-binding CsgD family transcriptional regulator
VGVLSELGITEREELVYTSLIDRPGSTAAQLAPRCGLSTPTVARVLTGLRERGLVVREPGRGVRYSAVGPSAALDVLVRRRSDALDEVREVVAGLAERHEVARRLAGSGEMVEVVQGDEAVRSRWLQLQYSARTSMRAFDKPPYLYEGNPAQTVLLRQGVVYRTVYDREALRAPGKLQRIEATREAGEVCRIGEGLPMKLFIADERMALAPLRESADIESAVVVYPSALLSALVALFESFWEKAVPFRDREVGSDTGLTPLQRKVLDLLDAGLTDEAIGRHLGIGHRTVQRRMGELMEMFGAHTRYQLGVQTQRLRRE